MAMKFKKNEEIEKQIDEINSGKKKIEVDISEFNYERPRKKDESERKETDYYSPLISSARKDELKADNKNYKPREEKEKYSRFEKTNNGGKFVDMTLTSGSRGIQKRISVFGSGNGIRGVVTAAGASHGKEQKLIETKNKNDLSGLTAKNAVDALDAFTTEEITGVANYALQFSNNKNSLKKLDEAYERYLSGETGKKANEPLRKGETKDDKEYNSKIRVAQAEENFFKNYEVFPYDDSVLTDKATGTIARAFGNRNTGKVEVFYGASNAPIKILTGVFTGNKTAAQDWWNDARSAYQTPPNYYKALVYADKLTKKKYLGEIDSETGKRKEYEGLGGVAGFSKGGGEANYVASMRGVRSLTLDPAPVINPGGKLDPKKCLAIVPRNLNAIYENEYGGALNGIKEIPDTRNNLYTLDPKAGKHLSGRYGVIKNTTNLITAIPVDAQGTLPFSDHFIDASKVYDEVVAAKSYAKSMEKQVNLTYGINKTETEAEKNENSYAAKMAERTKTAKSVNNTDSSSEKISNSRTAEDKPKPRTR